MPTEKCVVLLSGGIDSATCLYLARVEGLELHCLTVDYGQTHWMEKRAARDLARVARVASHHIFHSPLGSLAESPLTGHGEIPKNRSRGERAAGIAPTYVPGRNLFLISLASCLAETVGADSVWAGFNADDAAGYPDCRPAFVAAALGACRVGTVRPISRIVTPLIALDKAGVVALAKLHSVPLGLTFSCYDPDEFGKACEKCDACLGKAEAMK